MTSPKTTFPLLMCHKIHLCTGQTMQQESIKGYINSTQEHTMKDSKMEKKKSPPNTALCRVQHSTARFPTQGKPEMMSPVHILYWETLSTWLHASLGG